MKRAIPVLTMTTDWGLRDHYVASFKGQLLQSAAHLQIIDISNEVEHFDILQASFLVRNAFPNFPPGTIHYIGLDSNNVSRNNEHISPILAIKCMEHIFIGSDSGIFSLILGNEASEVFKLNLAMKSGKASTASGLVSLIGNIVNGHPLEELGLRQEGFLQSYLAQAAFDADSIRAIVMYIDSFGNAIINISRPEFDRARKERAFTIFVRRSEYNIRRISTTYEDAIVGEIVAFFNQDGYMEIALNRASASGLLGIKLMDSIRIEFHDNQNRENDI